MTIYATTEEAFRAWLDLETTRSMCQQLAYEFGDLVYYKPGCFDAYTDDDPIIKLLYAAYTAGYTEGQRWAPA